VLDISVLPRQGRDGQAEYTEDGADVVAFWFTANKGEALQPLHKIASGGELSRTLLALKVALADVDDTATLVFDEIDSGVSGQAAQAVAAQMARLSQTSQVLCVTHSAQIAAVATRHFELVKHEGQRTSTQVRELDRDGRVRELARLLGAAAAGKTAVAHARALLELSTTHPL
ncbi:MAG: DNA repair protein RecN, partial [Alicyclobacillus sp.]|nr:DNA repair protein RecN [Alicyclobacillus sp.]